MGFSTSCLLPQQYVLAAINDSYQIQDGNLIRKRLGLKVNDQLVAYATKFSAVRLKNYLWSHYRALKAKVQCDFSSAYSPDNVL